MARSPRKRILELLAPEGGGERKRSVIAGLIGEAETKRLLKELKGEGLIYVRRCHGGQRIGLTS